MRFKSLILTALVALSVYGSANSGPVTVLRTMTKNLTKQLKQKHQQIQHNDAVLLSIIKKEVLPHVATQSMSQYVVGRHYWRQASHAQRKQFVARFVKKVVSTYAGPLKSYNNQVIRFLPMRTKVDQNSIASVRSVIEPGNGPSFNVTYQMVFSRGKWKIMDYSIDGVSLVGSYRAQFRPVLSQGGLAALNAQLK